MLVARSHLDRREVGGDGEAALVPDGVLAAALLHQAVARLLGPGESRIIRSGQR